MQHDLANQLRPACATHPRAGRHRSRRASSAARAGQRDPTWLGLDHPAALGDAVAHLADAAARVFVLAGDNGRGVAQQFVVDLGALRDDVFVLDGNEIAVRRQIALLRPTDVLVTLDFRRYERWLVGAAVDAARAGVWAVTVTDSLLSPLAAHAQRAFVVAAAGAGPFDSHIGTLAVFNVLVTGVADQLRAVATERLDRLEAVWQRALTDR
ncbi:MAG: SIS domain-containing protein [Ilumatobacteraceae bacterium]